MQKANAALIAAAPEMLKALRDLNQFLVENINPEIIRLNPKAHLYALKVLGQAEGRSK